MQALQDKDDEQFALLDAATRAKVEAAYELGYHDGTQSRQEEAEAQSKRIKDLEAVANKCIKSMTGSNCDELHWLEAAIAKT